MQVYSDLAIDYFKMFLLNVPATVVALGLWVPLALFLSHFLNHIISAFLSSLVDCFLQFFSRFFFLDDITGFEITHLLEVKLLSTLPIWFGEIYTRNRSNILATDFLKKSAASGTIQFHFHMVCCGACNCLSGAITHQTHPQRLLDLEGKTLKNFSKMLQNQILFSQYEKCINKKLYSR